jgi:hypothetical protein
MQELNHVLEACRKDLGYDKDFMGQVVSAFGRIAKP